MASSVDVAVTVTYVPVGRDRRIELYEVATGKLVWRIFAPPTDNGNAPDCLSTEDSKTRWVGGFDALPRRYDLSNRDPPTFVKQQPLSVSADGEWVAFVMSRHEGNMIPHVSIAPAPGERQWVHLACPDFHSPAGGNHLFSPDGRYLAWDGRDNLSRESAATE